MAKNRPNPFIPPSKNDELIPWLNDRRTRAQKRTPELRMRMNMAFVLGHQWIVWDQQKRTWARPPTPDADDPNAPIRLTINKLGGIVERAVSKLTKENPIPECRPASDDDADVSAAKVGTRIITHEMNRLAWSTRLTGFMFWPVVLGWSYMHIGWDAADGAVVDSTANADYDVETNGELHQGEIVIEEVPAYEMAVDPSAVLWEDARWCVRTVCLSREAVWERWGIDEIDSPENGRSLLDEVNELSNAAGLPMQKGDDHSDMVKVHQFWLRPGSRSKAEGMVVTWCGKTILEKMDFPYEHGRLPFVPFNLLPGMHNAGGRTWIDDLLPMQTDYNDARSREAELRRTMTPKVWAPIGSIDERRINSRMQVIPYANINGKPDYDVPDSGWMQQHEEGMNRSDAEMGERSGQNDATSGQSAANMPAAAILALQEQDDTKLAISAKYLAKGVQQAGWHILNLVKQFWTEERMIRTWSEAGDLEAQRFSGADIENVLDVNVESGSTLPRSKAARTQLALQLAPLGLIPDPRFLFRMLDIPGSEFMMEHMTIDAKQAQRENSRLRIGIVCPVHDFDNHAVHLTEHNNFRKTQEYEALDEETRAVFDAHCGVHNEFILQASQVPTGDTPQIEGQNMPPVPGTHTDPALVGPPMPEGSAPADGTPMYVNPATGQPNNPLAVAAGQAPSPLASGPRNIRKAAGIGGAGQPGAVPGVGPDTQAGSMGR